MTYTETLNYLYNALPMFSRMGSAAYKKDITNTILLCQALGDPQNRFRSIHVGGTNGKGSVSHMLASVLQEGGYKTGLYTSPHLYDFRERIKVNGQMCPEAYVVDFVEKYRGTIEAIEPSFFEITVAMAFDYFVQQQVDVAIIEVGLGGRLDSTNIIRPELSVITNIGWDHMNLLGDNLKAIAGEKAGIIKTGIPVVIGEQQAETDAVFCEQAHSVQAPIRFADAEYEVVSNHFGPGLLTVDVRNQRSGSIQQWQLDLPGPYQLKNILTVLAAIDLVRERWPLSDASVKEGLLWARRNTGLQGRWEVLRTAPTLVLEVAHNNNGMEEMLGHLKRLHYDHLHLVIGMVKDKDVDEVLRLLPKAARYYFTQAGIPRALSFGELQQKGVANGLQGEAFADVNTAITAALQNAGANDLVIVCGSIFLVAEVKRSDFELA